MRDPGKIHAGASFDFDPDIVSYWSQWLGHPKPHILIIGEDFGDIEYFKEHKGFDSNNNDTNGNLFRLLTHIGLTPTRPPNQDRNTRVFLTNAILCLKEPPMNSPVRNPWVQSCAINHLQPLIQELNAPIIVAMGSAGWRAARYALRIESAPEKISAAAGGIWTAGHGVQVFAVGHCGPLGLANRPLAMQLEDWSRIGDAYWRIAESNPS